MTDRTLIDRTKQPYLFLIDVDGVDSIDLTSFIRTVEFYRNEILITYLETKENFVYKSFKSNGTKEWTVNYLDSGGEIIEKYRIVSAESAILKLPTNLSHSEISDLQIEVGVLSIPVSHYVKVLINENMQ